MTVPDPFQPTLDGVETLSTENCTARKPQAVVLHYTAGGDEASQQWLTKGAVSTHYLVKSDASVAQIVSDGERAWHAGGGEWKGLKDINSLSCGIEIVGWGFEDKHVPESTTRTECKTVEGADQSWFPFPEVQLTKVATLCKDLQKRWNIQPQFFIGHSDLAPGRKTDPGPLFPWERLHREFGIGAWPDLSADLNFVKLPKDQENKLLWAQLRLRDYGYSSCP